MKILSVVSWIEKNKENLIALIAAAVLAFFFLLNSPIHIWRCAETGTDSSVFKTVALMMDKGYMPYRDSFDHKGPLIYIINYLGLKISYYRGVWLFEMISMTITFFMLYKIARLKTKIASAVLVALTAMSLLFVYFMGGNFTEEYAMSLIAVSLYIFLEYLLKGKISWYRILISGISLGSVCMLKPNTTAVWIVFCSAIFFRKIWKREWKQLGQFILCFLIGFLMIIIPIIVWLAANGALQSCFEDYILFNLRYSSESGGATPSTKWRSFITFASTTIYFLALFGIAYNLKKNPFSNITYALYMIIGLILISMSGKTYGYYGMVLVPVVVYPLSLIMEDIEKLQNRDIASVIKLLITAYMMTTVIIPNAIETIKAIPSYFTNRNSTQFSSNIAELCETVSNLTSENDAISAYGQGNFIYVKTHRKHATQYSYQFPIGQVMPEIMDEYFEQLSEELPSVIVVKGNHNDENIRDFLTQNGYKKVWPEYITEEEIATTDSNLVFYRPQD